MSDTPENTEVTEDKAPTFTKGDINDLARKLDVLCDNPEKVQGYRREAADFICKKYNWDCVTDRTVEVYL